MDTVGWNVNTWSTKVMIKVITLHWTFKMLIASSEKSLMKKISSHHQKKKGICNKKFHGWYILFLKTMKLLMNNKRHPYSYPQMFNNNLFCQHGHFMMKECLRSITNKRRLTTMAWSNHMNWLRTWLHWKSTYTWK
jgi:hypothetical protein